MRRRQSERPTHRGAREAQARSQWAGRWRSRLGRGERDGTGWFGWLLIAGFALAGVLLAITSMRLKSVTYDEVSHLPAGYTYWKTGDFRMTPDHPPLVQLLAAAPLLAMDLWSPSTDEPSWQAGFVWKYGRDLLNRPNDAEAMLYWGRMPMVGLWCAGGLLACAWSRRLFGAWGGVITAAVYFLSPNLIAHGRLVTTDTAAGVFFMAALWSACALLEEISLKRLVPAALSLAGLFLSKFSAPLVIPVLLALVAWRSLSGRPWRVRLFRPRELSGPGARAGTAAGVGLFLSATTMLAIWGAFGFRYAVSSDFPAGTTAHLIKPPLVHDPTTGLTEPQRAALLKQYGRDDIGVWEQLVAPSPAAGKLILAARDRRLLPEAYLYGLAFTVQSTSARQAFLLGRIGEEGWWYYFPVAWAIKTPLPTLGVIFLALWVAVRRRSRGATDPLRRWSVAALLLFVAVYTGKAMTGHLNLGLRHMIPVQMASFILCGSVAVLLDERRRALRWAVPVLLAFLAAGTVSAWPDYIPYFNLAAGGSRNGWKYLADSNVDWGQDLPRLARYLREHGEKDVKLAYFGSGRPEYYGIRASYFTVPYEAASLDGGPPGPPADFTAGTYVVSATALQGWNLSQAAYQWDELMADAYRRQARWLEKLSAADTPEADARLPELKRSLRTLRYARLLAGLRARQPDDMIGKSILIYRLTQADLDAILDLKPPPSPDNQRLPRSTAGVEGVPTAARAPGPWYRPGPGLDPAIIRPRPQPPGMTG